MEAKHWLGWAAALGATGYVLQNGVPEVAANTAALGVWATQWVVSTTNWLVANALQWVGAPTGIAQAFLPTVATGVAGEYGMRKLADLLKLERSSRVSKAMRVSWAAAGALAGATLDPSMYFILLGAWLIAAKDVPLWILGKAGQWVGAAWWWISSFTWGALKWAWKWALSGIKNGWSNPSIKPQIGF